MAKIISSYGIEIRHTDKIFYGTIAIYRAAVAFCTDVFEKEWALLIQYDGLLQRAVAERLIHSTAGKKGHPGNTAEYPEFDRQFYKMPSYLRRSAINRALGILSAYHSSLDSWEKAGRQGRQPGLQPDHRTMPVFYRDDMFRSDGSDTVELKLYHGNDWVWIPFRLKHTDMQYIRHHCSTGQMKCPILERKNHKWFLRFAFEDRYTLEDKTYREQTILAVDLGISTDAVCSVMRHDGTVIARKFINFAGEKDRIYHTLNMIKKVSQTSGSANTAKLWRYAKMRNEELARLVAKAIAGYAASIHCDVIVFEYLDIEGRKHGSKKQKLHMWRKNTIQALVEHRAHLNGIRIRRVCARNTSRLACDGSGTVSRGREAGFATNRLCRFANGKVYNCDLSASCNIGARYFITEIEKSIPAKEWSRIQAEVPECGKRTQCTYATLLKIIRAA